MEFADYISAPNTEGVVLHRPFHQPLEGTLCITGHHFIISSRENKEELWMLHRMVDSIEKKLSFYNGTIILKCKDFRILQLDISGVEECNNVASSIEYLMNLEDPRSFYPFFYRALFDILEDGWTSFLPEIEYNKVLQNKEEWRISQVNKDYSVCPTYPQLVIVPKSIDDETLKVVAGFRQFGRFPILSYYHKENKAALLRSSQPMVGANNKRCKEDERLLNIVLGSGKKGYIIDTRSQNIALLARTKGGGFEPDVNYPLWKRMHKPIDRYFNLLESLTKLVEACNDNSCSVDKWLSRLESSGWLTNVKDVLTCACLVAQCLEQDSSSVLVHGAEGTDATLTVCALTQIILNPDCRTVHGFEALIEREFLQAGHPFSTRCQCGAYASANSRSRDQSPTFLMFLDCVHQIHQQFPCSFEFNEQFLITLFEHSYASQFGTFLGNCDKDRHDLKLSKKTVSLWSMLNRSNVLLTYLNPMYEPNNSVIWPTVAPQSVVLWSGMYLRWVVDQKPQLEAWTTIAEIREKEKELQSRTAKLRRTLLELEREAELAGIINPPEVDLLSLDSC
ncbi:myotubularin-related protein 9-like [Uloborus diversus]|uniref:myotubularin-related protein 9-like n=1 Tax=Uloborus diversus TaxID=327109 RepID=UPI00240A41FC|nr:myotubularin-related protein 9-like [Uloborus diversus]XP_054724546.1 myotubularin-related protein 9-like [Uloborus diversus]